MKLMVHESIFYTLFAIALTVFAAPVLAQVYKTVDENGNVTYTDQPPYAGAQPIELRPISVIEAPMYEPPASATDGAAEGEGEKELSLGYLRKNYADFTIIAPGPEETFWNLESPVTVTWGTRYQLQEGMKVIISVDGIEKARTTQQTVALGQLERGEHTIQAQLTDARNRRIATATPITFYIRQPNIYTNRARPGGR